MSTTTIVDLDAGGPCWPACEADVCVVGGGAAGLYLQRQLANRGVSVVLVEAGPLACADTTAVGFEALQDLTPYRGAEAGRYFGIGGSTARWGGVLVPHRRLDVRSACPLETTWRHVVQAAEDFGPQVLRELGFHDEWKFDESAAGWLGASGEALNACGLSAQTSLYLPFSRRNFARLIDLNARTGDAVRVFANAVTRSWDLERGEGRNARVRGIEAVSPNGSRLSVRARHFVVSAGAIESARILLEIDEAGSLPVLPAAAAVGCYLGDHLSMTIADVDPGCLAQAVSMFGPRFSGAWMYAIRFLESSGSPDFPRGFAHFIFSHRSRGFDLAREVLGAWQAGRAPTPRAGDVIAGAGDLIRMAIERYAGKRLFIPRDASAHLQLDVEQERSRENRITLSDSVDRYGRRVARIRWRIGEEDRNRMSMLAARVLSSWKCASADLPALSARTGTIDESKPYDAFHPVGTCRMGDDNEAVVSADLRVRGSENLWAVTTGLLPSAGSANPTFTMLCLAHGLACRLAGAPKTRTRVA